MGKEFKREGLREREREGGFKAAAISPPFLCNQFSSIFGFLSRSDVFIIEAKNALEKKK